MARSDTNAVRVRGRSLAARSALTGQTVAPGSVQPERRVFVCDEQEGVCRDAQRPPGHHYTKGVLIDAWINTAYCGGGIRPPLLRRFVRDPPCAARSRAELRERSYCCKKFWSRDVNGFQPLLKSGSSHETVVDEYSPSGSR